MSVSEIQFQVLVDPNSPPITDKALCFETGASRDQLGPGVYEHHGEGFRSEDPGALTRFYEDLLLGTSYPLVFATRELRGPDTLVAMAIFMYRDLALIPETVGLVASVDLYHRWGPPLLAHVEPKLAGFLRSFSRLFPPTLSNRERGERIGVGVQWVREFLTSGVLPELSLDPPCVRVLDIGSNSFVLAETVSPSIEAWEILFRQGHLRGVLLGQENEGLRFVMAARKHERSWSGMANASVLLNDLEALSGGDPAWACEGNYLRSPDAGSKVVPSYLLEVFLRV